MADEPVTPVAADVDTSGVPSARNVGPLSKVLEPCSVANGFALPVALGEYSVTEFARRLATSRSPAMSVVSPEGPLRPVALPESVATGETLPEAPGAYFVTDEAPPLATNRKPPGPMVTPAGEL